MEEDAAELPGKGAVPWWRVAKAGEEELPASSGEERDGKEVP